jgi:hypothetical protein
MAQGMLAVSERSLSSLSQTAAPAPLRPLMSWITEIR